MISRENYEVFFLDYMEGRLDEITQKEVESFLTENQDLKEELDGLMSLTLPEESSVFENKNSLRRESYDDEAVFEDTCIALIEEDLSIQGKDEFEKFLSYHPELRSEVSLYRQTRLVPDPLIHMPHRNSLYREKVSAVSWYKVAAAAAVLTTIITVSGIYKHHQNILPTRTSAIASLKEHDRNKIEYPIYDQAKREVSHPKTQNAPSTMFAKTFTKNEDGVSRQGTFVSSSRKPNASSFGENKSNKGIIFQSIKSISASGLTDADLNNRMLAKIEVNTSDNFEQESSSIGKFLTDQLTPVEDVAKKVVRPSKIARLGLSVISVATGRMIDYKTNDEGNIRSVSFDAKLVAFNIPVGKEE